MNASDIVEDSNGEDEVTYADYRLRTEDDRERLRRNISFRFFLLQKQAGPGEIWHKLEESSMASQEAVERYLCRTDEYLKRTKRVCGWFY